MNYNFILIIFISFLLNNCSVTNQSKISKNGIITFNKYKNSGFALIYDEDNKSIKKLDQRSLNIYHKSLKRKSIVKITNPKNGKSLIAQVKSNRVEFSNFYNSVLSSRIVEVLELDSSEPFIEIVLLEKDTSFVAKKSKTYDEERNVAEKAPVDGIQINDLNEKNTKKEIIKKEIFSYSIKIADFYYKDTAKIMKERIMNETSLKNIKIIKLSLTKYRVLLGPFNDIKTLKNSFEKMNSFNFENLEILKDV